MGRQLEYPIAVRKRSGHLEEFTPDDLAMTIFKGAQDLGGTDRELAQELASQVSQKLSEYGRIVESDEVDEAIFDVLREKGHDGTAWATKIRARRKQRAREKAQVLGSSAGVNGNTTNAFLMVNSLSRESSVRFDRNRIVTSLINEAGVEDLNVAKDIAEDVQVDIFGAGEVPQVTTQLIRENAHVQLLRRGMTRDANRYRSFGMPRADLEQLMMQKIQENSNVISNNPEAINFGLAGSIQKAWALSGGVFSEEVAQAHNTGAIHLHDLDMPARRYCSAHSPVYLMKNGLKLPTSSSFSAPAKHAAVFVGHLNTSLATLQAFYAGALGVADINVFLAPYVDRDLEAEGRKRLTSLWEEHRKLERETKGLGGVRKSALEKILQEQRQRLQTYEQDPRSVLSEEEQRKYVGQIAQMLLFNGSQNAFSRGSQTLFLDFNIHPGVPKQWRNTPIIHGGKYQFRTSEGEVIDLEERPIGEKTRKGYDLIKLVNPQTGEVVLRENVKIMNGKEHLEQKHLSENGKVLVYGDYEGTARDVTRELLIKFAEGDARGAPFPFPKCDFHVSEELIENVGMVERGEGGDEQLAGIFDLACETASKNGATYFVFDRDDVTMSACCRLRTTVDDNRVLYHPESLRFCGFQNVTVNMAQAAYRATRKGQKNLEGFLEEIDGAMELAMKAHLQKRNKIREFEKPGGPQAFMAIPSLDGQPYSDLDDATYIIGLNGLNDATHFLFDKELHEMTGEELKELGLRTIAHMNAKAKELGERHDLKVTLEESPAESATKRLATMDLIHFPESGDYVKGDLDSGVVYYTNSIHLAPDAPVDLVTRIKKQGIFHPAIESGAITHAFVGEHLPSPTAIRKLVAKTFKDTQTAQITFSPEITVCEKCNTTSAGLKERCPNCNGEEIYGMSRIVGYFSKIHHGNSPLWLDSKQLELQGRHEGNYGEGGLVAKMSEMPRLNGGENGEYVEHRFGKPGCKPCAKMGDDMEKVAERCKENGIEVEQVYHDIYTEDGMTAFLVAGLNPSRVPAAIIMKGDEEVYRHETNWGGNGRKFTSSKIMEGAIREHKAQEVENGSS